MIGFSILTILACLVSSGALHLQIIFARIRNVVQDVTIVLAIAPFSRYCHE